MLLLRHFITEKLWYITREHFIYSKTLLFGEWEVLSFCILFWFWSGLFCGFFVLFFKIKNNCNVSYVATTLFLVVWANSPSSYVQGRCLRNQEQTIHSKYGEHDKCFNITLLGVWMAWPYKHVLVCFSPGAREFCVQFSTAYDNPWSLSLV